MQRVLGGLMEWKIEQVSSLRSVEGIGFPPEGQLQERPYAVTYDLMLGLDTDPYYLSCFGTSCTSKGWAALIGYLEGLM